MAITNPDMAIRTVSPSRRYLRFRSPAIWEIVRLVSTASAPDIAIPWPARPSVMCSSRAIGVSRLTGINSEAISTKTQSVMANTPPQCASVFLGDLLRLTMDIISISLYGRGEIQSSRDRRYSENNENMWMRMGSGRLKPPAISRRFQVVILS
ncbi:hypothetical protein D3C78_698540 [compost metagenome]